MNKSTVVCLIFAGLSLNSSYVQAEELITKEQAGNYTFIMNQVSDFSAIESTELLTKIAATLQSALTETYEEIEEEEEYDPDFIARQYRNEVVSEPLELPRSREAHNRTMLALEKKLNDTSIKLALVKAELALQLVQAARGDQ